MPCHQAILLAAHTFTTEHREAIERAAGGVIPAELLNGVLVAMINTGEVARSEVNDIDDALDLMYQMRLDTQVMLAMLPRFLEYQRTRRVLNSRYTSPDFTPADVYNEINLIRSQVSALSADESVVVDAMDIDLALPSADDPPIPFGIDTLDSRLGGGVKRKKVVMVCAYTGYGKTTFGLNICWRNSEGRGPFYAATGLRTAFATTELPREECLCRYYSMLLSYPFEVIWKGDVSGVRSREEVNADIQRALRHRVASDPIAHRSVQNFKVWDYSTKTLTPDMLERQLAVSRDAGAPIDVLVVDYIDKMCLAATAGNSTFRQDRRQELGQISKELERLAIEFNCLIVVLTQANDEGANRAKVRMTANRDARLKNDPVSLWIGLGASEKDRSNNVFSLTIDKNRDGTTFSMNVSGRLDIQRFNDYTEEVEVNLQFGASAHRQRTSSQ